jgi:hypothetical protein
MRDAETRDHLPPKWALRKPYPANLLTVPSCKRCNEGYSQDEEYYRLIVIGLFCFGEAAEEIFDGPIARSFDRRPALQEKMFGSLSVDDGDKPYVQTEGNRLGRVVQKIAIGLHYAETGKRPALQSWYKTDFFHSEPIPANSRLSDIPFLERFAPDFRYRFWIHPDDARRSLWQITHFEDVHWVVTISPKITDREYDPNQDWVQQDDTK